MHGTWVIQRAASDSYFSLFHRSDERESRFVNTRHVLREIGYDDVTPDDCETVHQVCTLVSERAAFLASAGKFQSPEQKNKTNTLPVLAEITRPSLYFT